MNTLCLFFLFLVAGFNSKDSTISLSTIPLNHEQVKKITNQNRIYVNEKSDSATADGTSWQRAYPDLAYVLLNKAKRGDTIWLARGRYVPTKSTNRDISFIIPSGVVIIGGFSGNEISTKQRNLFFNASVLTGDIGVKFNRNDNSYHVIRFTNQDSTTVLDGLRILDGNALDAPETPYGAGIYFSDINQSCPKIPNCLFQNNMAKIGGAIYANAQGMKCIKLNFFNCSFYNNRAVTFGGALYLNSENSQSSFLAEGFNSVFDPEGSGTYCSSNKAGEAGGGFYFNGQFKTISIFNYQFNRDTCIGDGGAIFIGQGLDQSSLKFDYSRFEENVAKNGASCFVDFNNNVFSQNSLDLIGCSFIKNATIENGAGIYIRFSQRGVLEIKLSSSFYENISNNGAAGIFIQNKQGTIFLKSENTFFRLNKNLQVSKQNLYSFAYVEPLNNNTSTTFKAQFINSIFDRNQGAMSIFNSPKANCDIKIINASLWNNGKKPINKTWFSPTDNGNRNQFSLINSIIWEDSVKQAEQLFENIGASAPVLDGYFIEYSLLCSGNQLNMYPFAFGSGNIFNENPSYSITDLGPLFRLPFCSAAINAGKNIDSLPKYDAYYGPRILQGRIDIGAIEQTGFLPEVVITKSISCPGANNAQIALSANGRPPYQFTLNGKPFQPNTLLKSGAYQITVMDSLGCKKVIPFIIPDKDSIKISYRIKNVMLPQPKSGTIFIDEISGGTPPYKLVWSTKDTTKVLTEIGAGGYNLTVIDANQCFNVFNFKVDIATTTQTLEALDPDVLVRPNPVSRGTQIFLEYQGLKTGHWQISLYNLSGQIVHRQEMDIFLSKGGFSIPYLFDLVGIYVMTLRNSTSGDLLFKKVVVTQ